MTKVQLIKWLEKKQAEAIAEAKAARDKKVDEIKENFYEDLGVNTLVEIVVPVFKKAFAAYEYFFDKVDAIENVSISRYGYRLGYHDVRALTDEDKVKSSITEVIHLNSHPVYKEIQKVQEECNNVKKAYDTVIETVKNLPSAKDGIEYLKKLGFDISEIQPVEQKKQLPATINVNVDVRYLLLGKKKEEEA